MADKDKDRVSAGMALWAATRWDNGLRTNVPKHMTPEQEKALATEMVKRNPPANHENKEQ